MKTLNAFVQNSPASEKLTRAVIRQLGGWKTAKESMLDIARHGVDGGFCGFVYYKHQALKCDKAREPPCHLEPSDELCKKCPLDGDKTTVKQ